ncbi:hypothetical protein JCM33374_g6289 [Metschnikowia sp. JCM 33374]|nr:hypothetical protein JCM33374_g6289 [Metschnikowia sp. JCM 33374]
MRLSTISILVSVAAAIPIDDVAKEGAEAPAPPARSGPPCIDCGSGVRIVPDLIADWDPEPSASTDEKKPSFLDLFKKPAQNSQAPTETKNPQPPKPKPEEKVAEDSRHKGDSFMGLFKKTATEEDYTKASKRLNILVKSLKALNSSIQVALDQHAGMGVFQRRVEELRLYFTQMRGRLDQLSWDKFAPEILALQNEAREQLETAELKTLPFDVVG